MRFFGLPPVCSLLLVGYLGGQVGAVSDTNSGSHRVLRAATKRSDFYRRSVRIAQTFESEVSYIEEENGWSGKTTFASRVKVSSEKPILNLEEIEHHIEDVQCSNGVMKLRFVDDVSARDARFACHGKMGGLVITSHESCNKAGERAVYRVQDVSFADDGDALVLSVAEASWQGAFDTFDISFGHTTDDHFFRHHSDFAKLRGKRQVEIPTNTPDNVNTATFRLYSQLLDTTFPAESFVAGLQAIVPIPALPIEIGCKNCTTHGELILTQGAFEIDVSQIDFVPDVLQGGDDGKDITKVIKGGFFELAATGVGAHLELFTKPKVSGAFEIALFKLPILGFVIPGIGQAGAAFEPRIAVSFDITGGIELTYGVHVAVPNDSKIRVELSDLSKSSVKGFPGSTLLPLPIVANATDTEVLLGLAFKPSIPIGFQFANKLKAETTISMNLPRLDAKLSTNKQKNCGNQTISTNNTMPNSPSSSYSNALQHSLANLGNLALVEANISISVDVALGIELPLLPPPINALGVATPIFSTVFPLVTSCASPDEAFKTISAIVPAPTSNVYYANSTSAASTPCATKTVLAPSYPARENTTAVHEWPTSTSHIIVSQSPVKEPPQTTVALLTPPCNETISKTLLKETPVHETSVKETLVKEPPQTTAVVPTPSRNGTTWNTTIMFQTSSQAPPPATTVAPGFVSPPPAASVTVSAGFLDSNASSTQKPVATFTGAAIPGIEVPMMKWATIGWQMSAVGVSMMLGALVL